MLKSGSDGHVTETTRHWVISFFGTMVFVVGLAFLAPDFLRYLLRSLIQGGGALLLLVVPGVVVGYIIFGMISALTHYLKRVFLKLTARMR
jgi:hypothetical protein